MNFTTWREREQLSVLYMRDIYLPRVAHLQCDEEGDGDEVVVEDDERQDGEDEVEKSRPRVYREEGGLRQLMAENR